MEMERPRLLPLPPFDFVDRVVSTRTLVAVRGGPGAAQLTDAGSVGRSAPHLVASTTDEFAPPSSPLLS